MSTWAANLAQVRAAEARIRPHIHTTPLRPNRTLTEMAGCELLLKCENLQRTGSFKFRGALNAVMQLTEEEATPGAVTHSSGNFAQALALACRIRGIPAHIVMPETAPMVKQEAVRGYGGQITLCPPTLEARDATAARIQRETGATPIHPFDHPAVIAGHGSIGMELMAQAPDLDAVIVPVGGGGLLAGITLALRELAPQVRVFAAEPRGADDAWRSRQAGKLIPQTAPDTIADGLLTSLGAWTWPVVRDLVDDVLCVEEAEIAAAMRLVYERAKLVIEPSAAVSLAVALQPDFCRSRGLGKVAVVLSGGNVDLARLPWL